MVTDPQFVEPELGNLRMRGTSPSLYDLNQERIPFCLMGVNGEARFRATTSADAAASLGAAPNAGQPEPSSSNSSGSGGAGYAGSLASSIPAQPSECYDTCATDASEQYPSDVLAADPLCAGFALPATSAVPLPPRRYFVSLDGNDAWSGTLPYPNCAKDDGPFRTLQRVRDAVRSLRAGASDADAPTGARYQGLVLVELRGGVYELGSTLQLSALDFNIHVRAFQAEHVSVVGASRVPASALRPALLALSPRCVLSAVAARRRPCLAHCSLTRALCLTLPTLPRVCARSDYVRIPAEARDSVLVADLVAAGFSTYGQLSPDRPWMSAPAELFFDASEEESAAGAAPHTPHLSVASRRSQQARRLDVTPARLARFPNDADSFLRASAPWSTSPSRLGFAAALDSRAARWAGEAAAWVEGYLDRDFAFASRPLRAVNLTARTLELDGSGTLRNNSRFFVSNALSELDSPGEYYIDAASMRLFVWAPAGSEARMWLSRVENLLDMRGSVNVTFEGVALQMARGVAAYCHTCVGVALRRARLVGTGRWGAEFVNAQVSGVDGIDVADTGVGGISIDGGDRRSLTSGFSFVYNCAITRGGRRVRGTPGVLVSGCGNTVAHNRVWDVRGSGVQASGNEHLIHFNVIFRVGLDMEASAISLNGGWSARGMRVQNNFVSHLGWASGASQLSATGVALNDLTSQALLSRNVFFKIGGVGVRVGGGRDNTLRFNVFVDVRTAVALDDRGRQAGWLGPAVNNTNSSLWQTLLQWPITALPWRTAYPRLPELVRDAPGAPKGNRVLDSLHLHGAFLDTTFDLSGLVEVDARLQDTADWSQCVLHDPCGVDLTPRVDTNAALRAVGFPNVRFRAMGLIGSVCARPGSAGTVSSLLGAGPDPRFGECLAPVSRAHNVSGERLSGSFWDLLNENFENARVALRPSRADSAISVVLGAGLGGGRALTVPLSAVADYWEAEGVAGGSEALLSFALDPASAAIGQTTATAWLPSKSVRLGCVVGRDYVLLACVHLVERAGANHEVLAPYALFLEWRNGGSTLYSVNEESIPARRWVSLPRGTWTNVTVGVRLNAWVRVFINGGLVWEYAGLAHSSSAVDAVRIGVVSAPSASVVQVGGRVLVDNVQLLVPASGDRWVDALIGSDSNDGLSPSSPLASIQRAAALAGPGSTIRVRRGVYRERVRPQRSGRPDAPLRLVSEDGRGAASVLCSEAVPVTAWQRLSTNATALAQAQLLGLRAGVDPARVFFADVSALNFTPAVVAVANWSVAGSIASLRRLTLAREPDVAGGDPLRAHLYWWQADGGSSALPSGCVPTNWGTCDDAPAATSSSTQLTDLTSDVWPADAEPGHLGSLGSLVGARLVALDRRFGAQRFELPIRQHNVSAGRVTVEGAAQAWYGNAFGWQTRYFVEGAAVLLDQPGEWFVDVVTRRIFVLPPEGVDLQSAQFSLEYSLRSSAFELDGLSHVTLSALSAALCEGAAVDLDQGGPRASLGVTLRDMDVSLSRRGVRIAHTVWEGLEAASEFGVGDVTMEGCVVSGVDEEALVLTFWSAQFAFHAVRRVTIRGNVFRDMGFRGRVSSAIRADRPLRLVFVNNTVDLAARTCVELSQSMSVNGETSGRTLLADNTISRCSTQMSDGAGVMLSSATAFEDLLVSNNSISQVLGFSAAALLGERFSVRGLGGTGIRQWGGSGAAILRNRVSHAMNGIAGQQQVNVARAAYLQNTIVNCLVGLSLTPNANTQDFDTIVLGNVLAGNEAQGLVMRFGGNRVAVDGNWYHRNGWNVSLFRAGAAVINDVPLTTLAAIRNRTAFEISGREDDPQLAAWTRAACDNVTTAASLDLRPSGSSPLIVPPYLPAFAQLLLQRTVLDWLVVGDSLAPPPRVGTDLPTQFAGGPPLPSGNLTWITGCGSLSAELADRTPSTSAPPGLTGSGGGDGDNDDDPPAADESKSTSNAALWIGVGTAAGALLLIAVSAVVATRACRRARNKAPSVLKAMGTAEESTPTASVSGAELAPMAATPARAPPPLPKRPPAPVPALPSTWSEYKTDDGVTYYIYHNAQTGETTRERPVA
jgi:hypothetical protein